MSGARSSSNQHAVWCESVSDVYSGIMSPHAFIACGQRVTNGHPFGGSIKSGGDPGIDRSLSSLLSKFGIEDNNPHVYGCLD